MIIEAIKEKKGRDIVLIDLNKITNSPCSFFLICSTTSKTQINAIANHIEKVLLEKAQKETQAQLKGTNNPANNPKLVANRLV